MLHGLSIALVFSFLFSLAFWLAESEFRDLLTVTSSCERWANAYYKSLACHFACIFFLCVGTCILIILLTLLLFFR